MFNHVMIQDQWYYEWDIFDRLIVKCGERIPNSWNNAICYVIHNDHNVCPPKEDSRWDNPFYFGERIYGGVQNATETKKEYMAGGET